MSPCRTLLSILLINWYNVNYGQSSNLFIKDLDNLAFNLDDASKIMQIQGSRQKRTPQKDLAGKNVEKCSTPEGDAGRCVMQESCEWEEIKNGNVNYFDYACTTEDKEFGVCCPNKPKDSRKTFQKVPQIKDCGINSKSKAKLRAGEELLIDWPWMAVLLRKEDYSNFCGGVLLNSRYVLTAAHCTHRKTANDFYVRLGEYDFRTPNETNYVDYTITIIEHPEYDAANQRHDIALLKLNKPAVYTPYIRPICLPEELPAVNETLVVAGWGMVLYGGTLSDVLLEVPVPLWDVNVCKTKYVQPVFDTNVCAAGYQGGKDSCQGDSGGPLMSQTASGQWTNVGVVSWGLGCAEKDQPGIYTKVRSYIDWIAEHVNDAAP